MKKLIYVSFILFIIASCTGNGNFNDTFEVADQVGDILMQKQEVPEVVPISYDERDNDILENKKIIKNANIGVEVGSYSDYRIKMDSLINTLNGYISNDNLDKSDYSINCNLTIRIPATNFDRFINLLEKGTEKLLYKNISAKDVTEEFVDIEARLKTKKEVEKRYRELLAKAKNIKEILEVEEKLRILREEIEAREGRLNYLKKQMSYSTIQLQITQKLDYKYEPIKEKNFFQRLWKSLDKGWKGLVAFLLFLVRIWPVILIGYITFYYIRRIRRKKKLKREEEIRRNKQRKYYHKTKYKKKESNTNN